MVGFCEIDPFCQAVLKKHFPDVEIYDDIKALADTVCGTESQQPGRGSIKGRVAPESRRRARPRASDRDRVRDTAQRVRELETSASKLYGIDLLTASPPCQAASTAGKRRGKDDARWLWPQTVRIIGALQPRFVVLENVRGLLSLEGGLAFDKVCADVEAQGYEVWPFLLPACGVGAPHRRDRVWIVGRRVASYPKGELDNAGKSRYIQSADEQEKRAERPQERAAEFGNSNCDVADAERVSGAGRRRAGNVVGKAEEIENRQEERERLRDTAHDGGADVANPQNFGQPRSSRSGRPRLADRSEWNRDWREVAASTCHDRVDDGAPERVYGPDRISEAAHRRERLKACGNAIVPAVAVEIMKAIKDVDEN